MPHCNSVEGGDQGGVSEVNIPHLPSLSPHKAGPFWMFLPVIKKKAKPHCNMQYSNTQKLYKGRTDIIFNLKGTNQRKRFLIVARTVIGFTVALAQNWPRIKIVVRLKPYQNKINKWIYFYLFTQNACSHKHYRNNSIIWTVFLKYALETNYPWNDRNINELRQF